MKEQLRWIPLLAILVLGVASCGQVPTPDPKAVATPEPTAVPEPAWPAEAQPLVDLALARLAEVTKVNAADVTVVRVEEVNWPDGCLGCAKPDEMCTEAIVPGYRIILKVGDQEYEYRTDKQQSVRLCQAESGAADWGEATPLVKKAISDVVSLLSVPVDKVKVVSVEARNWNDSSLGCPEPSTGYLMVITPGYQIILEVEGQRYDYRTSETLVRLCKNSGQ